MDSLAVWQQHYPKISISHLNNRPPATNSTIRLNLLANRVADDMLNPFVPDYGPVWTLSHGFEVGGELHRVNLPEAPGQLARVPVAPGRHPGSQSGAPTGHWHSPVDIMD
jgi:hypothetical protein